MAERAEAARLPCRRRMSGCSASAGGAQQGQTGIDLAIVGNWAYIGFKFLVGMTKSGSTRSRSFLLPDRAQVFRIAASRTR